MKLEAYLSQKQSLILDRWLEATLKSYPADSSNFFKNEKNQFHNPIGYTFRHEMQSILEGLLKKIGEDQSSNSEKWFHSIHPIMKIKAVEGLLPSQAIEFVFHLKTIIRNETIDVDSDATFLNELLLIESRIDQLALLAMDCFMQCRESIYEIKANQVIHSTYRLLKKAEMISASSSNC